MNQSNYTTTIYERDIYLGFVHVQNLETAIGQTISKERERNGPFSSLEDFTGRVSIGIEQLIILIRIDAFRFTEKPKKQLLWEAHVLLGKSKGVESGPALFQSGMKRYKLPSLTQSRLEDAYDEIELLGFPVTLSWFDFLQTSFRGDIRVRELKKHLGKKVRMAGHLVTIKYIKTVKNEWMHFASFIDSEGEYFDTVHFPQSIKKYPFRGSGTYLILGKVVEDFGFQSLEVEKMAKLPTVKDPRYD